MPISRPDKVLFPADGITKADLAGFYRDIGPLIVPHTAGRPLTMHRFPDGIGRGGFYQKEAPDYFPAWVDRVTVDVRSRDEPQRQVACNHPTTLVYLVGQGCITPHVWLSRAPDVAAPDRMIFDLDPAEDDFEVVREAARALRRVLDELEMVSFPMTTGSRGLHVVVPLHPKEDFDAVRAIARRIADVCAARHPDSLTTEVRKAARRGRLYLDSQRNGYAQTAVAPYAVRARDGAPVATPLDWNEVGRGDLHSRRYTVGNIRRRIGQKTDPWSDIDRHAQFLSSILTTLSDLESGPS